MPFKRGSESPAALCAARLEFRLTEKRVRYAFQRLAVHFLSVVSRHECSGSRFGVNPDIVSRPMPQKPASASFEQTF